MPTSVRKLTVLSRIAFSTAPKGENSVTMSSSLVLNGTETTVSLHNVSTSMKSNSIEKTSPIFSSVPPNQLTGRGVSLPQTTISYYTSTTPGSPLDHPSHHNLPLIFGILSGVIVLLLISGVVLLVKRHKNKKRPRNDVIQMTDIVAIAGYKENAPTERFGDSSGVCQNLNYVNQNDYLSGVVDYYDSDMASTEINRIDHA